jgi:hypothetical protein
MQEVYIIGNPGFSELLNKELHDNSYYIRGQVSVEVPDKEVQLYWIADRKSLHQFKRAVGADLVWKYRLNFYFDLEKFTSETSDQAEEWSADEKALMRKVMRSMAA